MNRFVVAVLGVPLCAVAVAGCASGHASAPAADSTPSSGSAIYTITTQATGRTMATPDEVTVTIGVQTSGASARAALSANNAKAAALLSKLKGSGVEAKDLQTAGLSVEPTYSKDAAQITGYSVSNTVQATLHDLKNAGSVIDAAASAVGNAIRIQAIAFSISDDAAAKAQARAAAVKQAQDQARQIAAASGAKLGRIRTIVESPEQLNQPTYDAASAVPRASVPIQPGQLEMTVDVQITYDIG